MLERTSATPPRGCAPIRGAHGVFSLRRTYRGDQNADGGSGGSEKKEMLQVRGKIHEP